MKKIFMAFGLLLASYVGAMAQCNGIFPNNTVCGNVSGSLSPPYAAPLSSFSFGPGGTSGQIQYNNGLNGFAGFTAGGDCAINTSTGIVTCLKTNGNTFGPFATGIDAADLINHFDSGVDASSSTFWRGDGTWASIQSLTILNSNLNLYVSTTGNDSTGNGTLGLPWATCAKAISVIQSTYALTPTGTITINFENGTYTFNGTSYCQLNGLIAGQGRPGQLVFSAESIGTLSNVVFSMASGYCFGMSGGAMATLQWITCNGQNDANDMVNVGGGSQIYLANVECENNLYPGICLSVYGQSYAQINGPLTDVGGAIGQTCTWSSGSNSLSCVSVSNVAVGMGVTAGNSTIPWPCSVTNIVSTTVTVSCDTTGSGSSISADFWYGGDALMTASQGSQIYANTNGEPANTIAIALNSEPYFQQATLFSTRQSLISLQAITWQSNAKPVWQQAFGQPWETTLGGKIDLGLSGFPSVPGNQAIELTGDTTNGGTSVTSLSVTTGVNGGMAINGFVPTTTTFSNNVSSITVACSSCGIAVGQPVIHPCVAGGTIVSSGGGASTTVGLSSPTICASGSGDVIYFTNYAIPNGDLLSSIASTTGTLGRSASATATPANIIVSGSTPDYMGAPVQ